jgi:hypothetical protein
VLLRRAPSACWQDGGWEKKARTSCGSGSETIRRSTTATVQGIGPFCEDGRILGVRPRECQPNFHAIQIISICLYIHYIRALQRHQIAALSRRGICADGAPVVSGERDFIDAPDRPASKNPVNTVREIETPTPRRAAPPGQSLPSTRPLNYIIISQYRHGVMIPNPFSYRAKRFALLNND